LDLILFFNGNYVMGWCLEGIKLINGNYVMWWCLEGIKLYANTCYFFEQPNVRTVPIDWPIDCPISNISRLFWAFLAIHILSNIQRFITMELWFDLTWLWNAGKLEEAIENLTEAIILNPTSAIMYANRGMIWFDSLLFTCSSFFVLIVQDEYSFWYIFHIIYSQCLHQNEET